jgi:DNA polymerase elongation subunit (family B)
MRKPKTAAQILMLDIETAPSKAYVWGLFNQNVGIDQIVEPGYTLCYAARWYGTPKKDTMYSSIHHHDNEHMLRTAHDLLDKADIVVHYNGTRFDIPTLQREFIKHGLAPVTEVRQVDLLQHVRKNFRFASNKLDFVAQELGIGKKLPNKGMRLWNECMAGDDKAWRDMKRYNIQDVHLLIDLYERLLPWIKNHPNLAAYTDAKRPTCPNCGSTRMRKWGVRHLKIQSYQRYRCDECHTMARGRKRIAPAQEGVLVS